jgi:hypothetical protein
MLNAWGRHRWQTTHERFSDGLARRLVPNLFEKGLLDSAETAGFEPMQHFRESPTDFNLYGG